MRATNPILRQRIEDVLRIRLDGAEGWDVRRYVAEQEAAGEPPWTIPEGGKPLSERQIRNYVAAADRLMDESCRQSRKKVLRRHLAQRRALYARALNKGDERTALAVLRDLAELQGLYGDETARQLEELRRELADLKKRIGDDGSTDDTGDNAAQPGADRPGNRAPEGDDSGESVASSAKGGPGPDAGRCRPDPGPVAREPLAGGPAPDAAPLFPPGG
jgi:hypothetical protein